MVGAGMNQFTRAELDTVVRWLEQRYNNLHLQQLVIENGDDFAFANNKWPEVETLKSEQSAVRNCILSIKWEDEHG